MGEFYTRRGSLSIKKEAAVGTPITPDTFIYFNNEDISVDYPYTPMQPVAAQRSMNIRAADGAIPAPEGTINLNIEPDTLPLLLLGLFGGVTSATMLRISNIVGAFVVGQDLTFAPSTATGSVQYVGDDFLLFTVLTGTPTEADGITQAVSGATADVDEYDASIYGHAGGLPAEIGTGHSYSIQFNYAESAVRYWGAYISGIDTLGQADNVLTAGLKIMALGQFRHAEVKAITTAAGGAQNITVDQTKGLVAADSIKCYRPSTGAFIDLPSAGVKIHTIDSITNSTVFVVTVLHADLAVGDLIMLAPQTATYSVDKEFVWMGGSEIFTDIAAAGTLAGAKVEDFTFALMHEFESRHAAQGGDFADRFPYRLLQKGLTGNGTIKLFYQDEDYIRRMRANAALALKLIVLGSEIGSTGYEHEFRLYIPQAQIDPYNTNLDIDKVMDEDIPFSMLYDATDAHLAEFLVVNDTASY